MYDEKWYDDEEDDEDYPYNDDSDESNGYDDLYDEFDEYNPVEIYPPTLLERISDKLYALRWRFDNWRHRDDPDYIPF